MFITDADSQLDREAGSPVDDPAVLLRPHLVVVDPPRRRLGPWLAVAAVVAASSFLAMSPVATDSDGEPILAVDS